jgi:hypothetical protein
LPIKSRRAPLQSANFPPHSIRPHHADTAAGTPDADAALSVAHLKEFTIYSVFGGRFSVFGLLPLLGASCLLGSADHLISGPLP